MGQHDDFPIDGWDHLELFVGNAKQAAFYYEHAFGFTQTAYSGPETGVRDRASYVVEQGDIRLVLTSGLRRDSPVGDFSCIHGDVSALILGEMKRAAEIGRTSTYEHHIEL